MQGLRIKDNGIGINASEHEKIFQRFARATDTYGQIGLSVGLSECRRIIETFGGSISITSARGVGSMFSIKMPTVPN